MKKEKKKEKNEISIAKRIEKVYNTEESKRKGRENSMKKRETLGAVRERERERESYILKKKNGLLFDSLTHTQLCLQNKM